MTAEQSRKLRELALLVTKGDLRLPWTVQTSNSFRRIGTDRGDGNVLCAVAQRSDGHPDLHAAPGVLDYIVAAHPFVVLELLDQRGGDEAWSRSMTSGGNQLTDLWDAINRYAISVGGDPSKHVYGNVARMQAVADVGKVMGWSRRGDRSHE
jgi:hypothetical protein